MRLQTALTAKGFNAGVADGIAGSGTRRAVQAFLGAVSYRLDSPDLAAIDVVPINAFAGEVETWVKPRRCRRLRRHHNPLEQLKHTLGKVFTDCTCCPEMVVLPSGRFMMGSNDRNSDEKRCTRCGLDTSSR